MSRTKRIVRLHEPKPVAPPVDGAIVIAALLALIAFGLLFAAAWQTVA